MTELIHSSHRTAACEADAAHASTFDVRLRKYFRAAIHATGRIAVPTHFYRSTSLLLVIFASVPSFAADFGIDPKAELRKLESGNLKLLERISLGSEGNLRTYLDKYHFRVVHELSDLACTEKQVGSLPAGCTVSLNVALGARVSNQCTTLLRWNQARKGASFQPMSGSARMLLSNPSSLVPAVQDMEARCR